MLAKTNEALIAQAQEAARNKHACSHVNAAHAAMIAFLINNPPPAFDHSPTADQFGNAKDYLSAAASAFGEVVYQVMREASFNSHEVNDHSPTLITDALSDDCIFADLDEAADDLSEEGRSDYAEHNTLHRAAQGV